MKPTEVGKALEDEKINLSKVNLYSRLSAYEFHLLNNTFISQVNVALVKMERMDEIASILVALEACLGSSWALANPVGSRKSSEGILSRIDRAAEAQWKTALKESGANARAERQKAQEVAGAEGRKFAQLEEDFATRVIREAAKNDPMMARLERAWGDPLKDRAEKDGVKYIDADKLALPEVGILTSLNMFCVRP